MIDLELATTGQILGELNKRDKSFVILFDEGSGITNATDTLECHVSNMGPHDVMSALAQAGMLLQQLSEGERPDNFSFLRVNDDGDIEVVDIDEEEESDPWSNN